MHSGQLNKKEHLPALDGIRAMAILLVVGYHVRHYINDSPVWLHKFLGTGWNGVHLFFCLSGFLIGSLAFREVEQTGTLCVWRFWLRRLLRTWPLYFFVLAVRYFNYPGEPQPHIVYYLTFLQNFFAPQFFAPSWSLAVEEHFYFILPIVAYLSARFWAPFARTVVLIGIPFAYYYRLHCGSWLEFNHTWAVLDYLLWGVVAAYMYFHRPQWLAPINRWPNLFAVFALWLIYYVHWGVYGKAFVIALHAQQSIGFALLVLSALSPHFWLNPLLRSRPAHKIAVLSYGVYLIHDMLLYHIAKVWTPLALSGYAHFALLFASALLVSLVLSWFLYKGIEQPVLKLRDRWIPRKKAHKAPQQKLQPVAYAESIARSS